VIAHVPFAWRERSLAAWRCLPVRVGEKSDASDRTEVTGECQPIELVAEMWRIAAVVRETATFDDAIVELASERTGENSEPATVPEAKRSAG
jgi:hypothetical protein